MQTVVRSVTDLNRSDRSVLERVVGHALGDDQRLVIQVMVSEAPTSAPQPSAGIPDLPDWADVCQGLSEEEIDELDAAIRERARLDRSTDGVG